MNPYNVPEMRYGHGAGIRGSECEICREQITDNDATITHMACENTFHRTCLDEWGESCIHNGEFATCPKCRARLSDLQLSDILQIAFAVVPPSLPEEDMYDYSMGDDFPTPAFVELAGANRARGRALISDYVLRLAQAQRLPTPEVIARFADLTARLGQGATVQEAVDDYAADTLHLDEVATDLETIDAEGNRTPRNSVMDSFERDPDQAFARLDVRLAGIRTKLSLTQASMDKVRDEFLRRVEDVLRARRDALQVLCTTSPTEPETTTG